MELGSWCLLIDDFEVSKLAFLSLHIWINYFNDSLPIWTTEIAPWSDHPTSVDSLQSCPVMIIRRSKNRLRWILWILVGKHVPVDIPESELSWTKFDALISFPFFLYYSLRKPFFNLSFWLHRAPSYFLHPKRTGWFWTQSHAKFTWLKRSKISLNSEKFHNSHKKIHHQRSTAQAVLRSLVQVTLINLGFRRWNWKFREKHFWKI